MTLTICNFLLVLGAWIVPTLASSHNVTDGIPNYFACGGVLDESVGAITYKADISISPNERCVWTIRSANATSYTINFLSFGLVPIPSDTGITATCLSKHSTWQINYTHVEITSAGVVNLSSSCHVLVLTFYSGVNMHNSRGFAMMYTATPGFTPCVNATSKNYIINDAEGHLRHPLSVEEQYTLLELTTFVYAPTDNIHSSLRKTVVTYVGDGLEEPCADYLVACYFHPTDGWVLSTQVCAEKGYEKWESDDLIMVIFISDEINVGRGFHLVHSHELMYLL